MVSARGSAGSGAAGGSLVLLCILLALAVVAFAVTRAVRSQDDLVNSVVLTSEISLAEAVADPAEIEFQLAEGDEAVDVEIIDGRGGSEGEPVRGLDSDLDLAAGAHSFEWDGRDDDGDPVAPGPYALRVVLGEADREIQPPGRIEVIP